MTIAQRDTQAQSDALALATLDRALRSEHAITVRRRVFRQLIESLIYEGIVTPEVEGPEPSTNGGPSTNNGGPSTNNGGPSTNTAPNDRMGSSTHTRSCEEHEFDHSGSPQAIGGRLTFRLRGEDAQGRPVVYTCYGRRRVSFERITLDRTPLLRSCGDETAEATSIAQFLIETYALHQADEERLARFIGELQETLLKDVVAQEWGAAQAGLLSECSYDELEGRLMDGHPYHPSYKSRVGFDYVDTMRYGPEFQQPIQPLWLAAHREWTLSNISTSLSMAELLTEELGAATLARFAHIVAERGRDFGDYLLLPVHPWQWRERIVPKMFDDLQEGTLILLGPSDDQYLPQQSIRTLSNASDPHKAYLKLSLSMLNTSTSRILAPHTVQNAPLISDWLAGIAASDPFLRDELRCIVLREIAGVTYDRPLPQLISNTTYGTLACIWRESLHRHLEPGEQAAPWNALTALERDGQPLIAPWVRAWGLEPWLRQLLEIGVAPLIHYLYAHGIALESHAQNMILVHRDGLPQRAAFKDFHDGVRFAPQALAAPERAPALHATSERHWGVNRNSYITTPNVAEVRDFMLDAFMFINLTELALLLDDHFGFTERRFWALVWEVIARYQQRFPQLQERFALFDLATPTMQVERLTNRRMFPETDVQVHTVRNPLAAAREEV